MTVVQNTETLPDGTTPIANVLVTVRIFGSTPAAMATGTGSLVGTASTRSNSAGLWSLSLTPNAAIKPDGTCYVFTRTYPPTPGVSGEKSIEYGIVPPSTAAVHFPSIVVSSPTAMPFTDSELTYLLAMADPFPQYLTQAEADLRYPHGTDTGGVASSIPHTHISDWDTALAARSLSSFAAPTGDIAMGAHKITGLVKGSAATDAASVQNVTDATTAILALSDPFPQYLTQTEGDLRYSTGGGGGGGGTLPTSEPHTFISDWVNALAAVKLSSFATPNADIGMGSHKFTGLGAGTADTDSANMAAVRAVAAQAPLKIAGGIHLWVQETAPAAHANYAGFTDPIDVADGDIWIQKSNALVHTWASGAWVAAGTTSGRRVVQGAANGPPTTGSYLVGEIAVEGAGRLWTCIVAGTPGTWYSAPLISVSSVAPTHAITGDIWVFAS